MRASGTSPNLSRTSDEPEGHCWDNACSETLFGSLKEERLHGQRFENQRQAKDERRT
jgi:transposase InsO family protein